MVLTKGNNMFSSKVRFNLSMLATVLSCVWYGMESALGRVQEQEYAMAMIVLNGIFAYLNYNLWSKEIAKKEKDKTK